MSATAFFLSVIAVIIASDIYVKLCWGSGFMISVHIAFAYSGTRQVSFAVFRQSRLLSYHCLTLQQRRPSLKAFCLILHKHLYPPPSLRHASMATSTHCAQLLTWF